jgi:hypothetical protein
VPLITCCCCCARLWHTADADPVVAGEIAVRSFRAVGFLTAFQSGDEALMSIRMPKMHLFVAVTFEIAV